jgi:hypothetical protein
MRTYVQIMCTDNNFEIALILVESQIDYCLVLTSRPRALLSERKEEGRGLVDSLCPSAPLGEPCGNHREWPERDVASSVRKRTPHRKIKNVSCCSRQVHL